MIERFFHYIWSKCKERRCHFPAGSALYVTWLVTHAERSLPCRINSRKNTAQFPKNSPTSSWPTDPLVLTTPTNSDARWKTSGDTGTMATPFAGLRLLLDRDNQLQLLAKLRLTGSASTLLRLCCGVTFLLAVHHLFQKSGLSFRLTHSSSSSCSSPASYLSCNNSCCSFRHDFRDMEDRPAD